MDEFKRINVVKATIYDFNCSYRRIRYSNRRVIAKMLNRYSRRKLKQKINNESI